MSTKPARFLVVGYYRDGALATVQATDGEEYPVALPFATLKEAGEAVRGWEALSHGGHGEVYEVVDLAARKVQEEDIRPTPPL